MRNLLAVALLGSIALLSANGQDQKANPDRKEEPIFVAPFREKPLEMENEFEETQLPATVGKRLKIEVRFVTIPSSAGEQTAQAVLNMAHDGRAKSFARTSVIAMDNQTSSAQYSEMVPVVAGYVNSFTNKNMPIYQWSNVGTMLLAKARLEKDGRATIQIYIERSIVSKSKDMDKPDTTVNHTARSIVNAAPDEPVLLATSLTENAPADTTHFVLSFKEIKQ